MLHGLSNNGIVAAAIAGLGVFALGFPVYRALDKLGIIDNPNQRSSHSHPTLRGGGVATLIMVVFFGLCLIVRQGPQPLLVVMLSAWVIAVVSFMEDIKSSRPLLRLGCHFGASLAAVLALGLTSVKLGFGPNGGLFVKATLSQAIGVIWIASYTNAFNFMDGINGIAAAQAALTAFGAAMIGGLVLSDFTSPPIFFSMVIAGASAGFLPHNFPRASMFMGDVGSAFLGFWQAVMVIWLAKVAGWWLLIPLALLQANFVMDTGITLIRRAMAGEQLLEPHREHFYQRLVRSGKSHTFVTGVEMGIQVLVVTGMICYIFAPKSIRILLIAMVMAGWSTFFFYCEVSFRRGAEFQRATRAAVVFSGASERDSDSEELVP